MRITILVLDISISGGVERVAASLANGFSKEDEVVIISVFGKGKENFYNLDHKVNIKYLIEDSFKLSTLFNKIKLHYLIIRELKKCFYNENSDVIISMFDNLSIYLSFFKCKSKVIAHQHGQYFAHSKLVRVIRKFRYKKLNAIVSLTETDKKLYEKMKNNNVYKIPNPSSFKNQQLADLKNKKILTVGRLVKDKGFDRLISMFSHSNFFKKFPDWKMNIYGEGPEKSNLQNLIDLNNLNGNIKLRGVEKEIEKRFLESSIYLCSSKQESFSMTILEAMSIGLPVVSFDCPTGPRELINNNENGILIANDAEKEYIDGIESLINSYSLRKKIGSEAKLTSQNFTIESIVKNWERIIKEIV